MIPQLLSFNQERSWKRIIADRALRYAVQSMNIQQLQLLLGTPIGVYEAWLEKNKISPNVEVIGDNTRLLWIGAKKTEKVVLYFHGIALYIVFVPSQVHHSENRWSISIPYAGYWYLLLEIYSRAA